MVIDMRHYSGVVCTRFLTWSRASARFRMGRVSRRRRRLSFRLLLRSRRAFLLSSFLSAGALADNSSAEISSRYRSGRVPEGPGVSPAAMKTWQSGEPTLESEVPPLLECAPHLELVVFPRGREVSRGRRRSVSSRLSGLRACGLASRRISRRV
jgi:hypothetical protein